MLRAQPPRRDGARYGGRRLRAFALLLALAAPATAQDAETLADIRQSLTVLNTEVEGLKRELSTTGGPSVSLPETALERIDAIEAALRDLTARTEALTGRIDRIVRDGTNRIGDLQFRLTELEGGDAGELGATEPLGGEAPAAPAAPEPQGGAELATAEQADYERAVAASEAGDAAEAARLFGAFAETYPGSPLAGEAQLRRGEALRGEGDLPGAARAFLAGFSGDPNGAAAPETLLALGRALGELGQTREACTTFAEVRVRFPDDPAADEAGEAADALGCG